MRYPYPAPGHPATHPYGRPKVMTHWRTLHMVRSVCKGGGSFYILWLQAACQGERVQSQVTAFNQRRSSHISIFRLFTLKCVFDYWISHGEKIIGLFIFCWACNNWEPEINLEMGSLWSWSWSLWSWRKANFLTLPNTDQVVETLCFRWFIVHQVVKSSDAFAVICETWWARWGKTISLIHICPFDVVKPVFQVILCKCTPCGKKVLRWLYLFVIWRQALVYTSHIVVFQVW